MTATRRYLGLVITRVGLTWYVPVAPSTMTVIGRRGFERLSDAKDWIRVQVNGRG